MAVVPPLRREVVGQRPRREPGCRLDAGAGKVQRLAAVKFIHRDDQCRRPVRIFVAAEREAVERRQVGAIGDEREHRRARIGGDRRPGLETQPVGHRRYSG